MLVFLSGGEREGKLWRGETVTILHHGESRDASVNEALSETSYLGRFGFSFRGVSETTAKLKHQIRQK